jgi:tRNA A22 N-methylase
LDKLHQVSGIVNKSQVKGAILRDFIEGRDYIWADEILCVNESTYSILMVSFRSVKGADISELPEIIRLNTREYFQH